MQDRIKLNLISKEEMAKRIDVIKTTNPISFSTYISKWGAHTIRRVYNIDNKDTLKLYTYVFPFATYRIIIENDKKGFTDCSSYAI